jgi:hypothetical protein
VTATMRKPGEVAMELLAFFRVASTDALRSLVQGQQVAFRQAAAYEVQTPPWRPGCDWWNLRRRWKTAPRCRPLLMRS